MTEAAGRSWWGGAWRLPALTGAILGKELRVASRRRRFYMLRLAYVLLLLAFVALVWVEAARGWSGSGAYVVSRMADVGLAVTITILIFQFAAVQLVAVVVMSPAISGELRSRTLGTLLATPLTSVQIVVGKVLGGMWQLLMLVALSLPLLAVVRVFGGVEWWLVLGGVCVTVTAALFVASVALLMSIFCRRTYASILLTLAGMAVLYLLVPLLIALWVEVTDSYGLEQSLRGLARHVHPFGGITGVLEELHYPGMAGPFSWPIHCAVVLGMSLGVLGLCVGLVRRVAFARALGAGGRTNAAKTRPRAAGHVRRIVGSPILWKELRRPLLRRPRVRWLVYLGVVAVLLGIYALLGAGNYLKARDTQVAFAVVFVIIGTIVAGVLSATTVSAERESRTLSLLLCSDLSALHILIGKAAGVARRTLPIWVFLFAHLLAFCWFDILAPRVLLHMLSIVVSVAAFLTGAGVYFSTVFRRTTGAVIANLGLGLGLWIFLPLVVGIATMSPGDPLEFTLNANPVIQAIVVADGARRCERNCGDRHEDEPYSGHHRHYSWPNRWLDRAHTEVILLTSLGGYASVGVLLVCLAACRLRRRGVD